MVQQVGCSYWYYQFPYLKCLLVVGESVWTQPGAGHVLAAGQLALQRVLLMEMHLLQGPLQPSQSQEYTENEFATQ
jgi:hypothetical protein